MTALVLQGDARQLPLPDGCADLVATSPPYWNLRSYTDGGEHYEGQIGSEETPQEYVASLVACVAECVRILKPQGSIFFNLADKYSDRGHGPNRGNGTSRGPQSTSLKQTRGPLEKSLLGLPWQFALACRDDLGLILRRDIIWHKVNPIPESATDRCRSAHEYLFHFVKQPRYFAAVDEIRTPHLMRPQRRPGGHKQRQKLGVLPAQTFSTSQRDEPGVDGHPLGALPGSMWEIPEGEPAVRIILRAVAAGAITLAEAEHLIMGDPEPAEDDVWSIPSQPLTVPPHLGVDHFAAFPMALPRRIILGWSPTGICTECGEGRRPVADVATIEDRKGRKQRIVDYSLDAAHGPDGRGGERWKQTVSIIGHTCACTPYTDHPERRGKDFHAGTNRATQGMNDRNGGERFRRYIEELANPRGPVREYHFDQWAPAPTRPAIVVDPFGGTGTTSLVADVLGRTGISFDRSGDYCRLARWRTTDPGERAKAMQVPKPPPPPEGMDTLFDLTGDDAA